MKTSLICLFVAIGLASAISPVVDQTDAIAESILPVLIGPMLHSIDEFLHLFIAIQPPVPIGRADGINVFQFLYDNVVSTFLSDITSNTANYLQNSLNNLLNKPFGIGKRDVQGDLAARVDFLSFIYDNILQDLFSGIVTNTFSTLTGALNNLIQTNPLAVGKRAEGVNVFQFLYDNVIADLFGGLASNTANYLQNSLNNLLNKPFGIGKRSIAAETILNLFAPLSTTLVEKLRNLVRQALNVWSEDRLKFIQLIQTALNEIKTTVTQVAQQMSPLVPADLLAQVSQILAGLQSMLIYWTSGLAGSLGPVLPAY